MAKSNKELWLEKYPFGYYNTESDKGTGAESIETVNRDFDDYDDESDFDIDWDDYERSLDIDYYDSDEDADYEHAMLYGGDTTYCVDCGAKKVYGEDGYSYCPECSARAEEEWGRKTEDFTEDRDEDFLALDEAYLNESRECTIRIRDLIDDGALTAEQVCRACVDYMSEDDAEDIANTLLDDEIETYGSVRQYSNALIDMCEEGSLSWETLLDEYLAYMSEDDVCDMAHSNEFLDDEEEEETVDVDTSELADNFRDFLIENGYREDCVTVNSRWNGWDVVTCKDDGNGEITVEFVEDDGEFNIYISDSFLFADDYEELVDTFMSDVIPYIEYEDESLEEKAPANAVHKKSNGDYLVPCENGGYSAFNASDAHMGHISAESDDEAKTLFMGNKFDECLTEDWTVFKYASGANPYVAKTEEETQKVLNKWGDKVKSVGSHYVIDDEDANEFTKELTESILTNDGYVTPSEGAVEQFLDKYGFSDDRYQKDVYTDNASKGKEIIASFVDGINSADYRRISERAKEFFGECPVEVRLGKEHKDGDDLWATLVFDFGKCSTINESFAHFETDKGTYYYIGDKYYFEPKDNPSSNKYLKFEVSLRDYRSAYYDRKRNTDGTDVISESSEGRYCIVARTNDGKFKFYKDGAFVDNYKEATIFTDMDEARSEWFDIDKSKYKRVFIPNYDESSFASLNENKEDDLYDYKTRQATGSWDRDDDDYLLNQSEDDYIYTAYDRYNEPMESFRTEKEAMDYVDAQEDFDRVAKITKQEGKREIIIYQEDDGESENFDESTDLHFIDKSKRSAIYGEDDYGYDEFDVKDENPLPHIKMERGNRHITLNDTSKVGEEGHPIQRGLNDRVNKLESILNEDSNDDLFRQASKAYKVNDNDFFTSLSDDELVTLWVSCSITDVNPYGASYDDEVYDAIAVRPNSRELFDRATEIVVNKMPMYNLVKVYARYYNQEPDPNKMGRERIVADVLKAIKANNLTESKHFNEALGGDAVEKFLSSKVVTVDGVTGIDPKAVNRNTMPRGCYITSSSLLGGRVYDHGTIHWKGDDYVFRVRKDGSVKVMTDAQAGSNWSETIFKESKQLNEGPGAGYTLSGKLKITAVESLTPIKFEDADYGSYDVTFNCVALGTIEDFEFYSYMYGDKMDSAEVEISAIKTNFYAEHIDDIEALVRNNLEEVKDCLVGATVHIDYVYGAGWLHSKFDGTIAEIDDTVKDSDIVYGDTFDIEVFEFDAKIKDTDVIEYVDKAVSGDNISYMYTVIDEDGNPGDAFFEEEDAIEYAKKNNCQAVDRTECKELFGGETEWLDSEIVWENDSDGDFE